MAESDPVKGWEDQINIFFENTSEEFDLRAWKYLRLRHPNWSSQLVEIDRAITAEIKKRGEPVR